MTGRLTASGVRCRARLVAETAVGRTCLTTLYSEPPVALRATAAGVHLVASAAGPIGGDDLGLSVRLEAGTTLAVRGVGATVCLPGPSGEPSTSAVDIEVAHGASLHWLPEPTIAAHRCDHRGTTTVRLAPTAALVLREEVVMGRHGEPGGSILQRLRVDVGGNPLLRNDLALGPRFPGGLGPASLAGARAVGHVLLVGVDDHPAVAGPAAGMRVGWSQLDDRSFLFTAIAGRPLDLRRVLATASCAAPSGRPDQ